NVQNIIIYPFTGLPDFHPAWTFQYQLIAAAED
ncbi:unnamed protein product, partial [marine sediment metagenome]